MNKITKIIQSPLFESQKKKLHKNQIIDLDAAVRAIVQNPELGSEKAGDLKGVQVYKFNSVNSLVLLAYEISENTLFLYRINTQFNCNRSKLQSRN